MAWLFPMISAKGLLICSSSISFAFFNLSTSLYDCFNLMAVAMVAISFSFCQGFKIKSVAPCFNALTAISTSPKAVIKITTDVGSCFIISSSQKNPSLPLVMSLLKFMSRRITSYVSLLSRNGIFFGFFSMMTWWFCFFNNILAARSTSSSSSIIRILPPSGFTCLDLS